jgi:hypothetical protein
MGRSDHRAHGHDRQAHFELFDAGHGGIDYRYPLALEWLCCQIADQPA